MGEVEKGYTMRAITLKEMFNEGQLHELLRCVSAGVGGDWSHAKEFLKRKDIEQHLLDQNILPEYLLRFLQYKVSEEQIIQAGGRN